MMFNHVNVVCSRRVLGAVWCAFPGHLQDRSHSLRQARQRQSFHHLGKHLSVVPLVLLPVQLTFVYRASNKAGHEYSPHNCELIYDGELPTLVAGECRTFTIVAKDSFGQQCLGTDPAATVR